MPKALAAMPQPAPEPEVHLPEPDAGPGGGPLPVLYPRYEVHIHAEGYDHQPIDQKFMEDLLGWESEKKWVEKMTQTLSEAERKTHKFEFGDAYDLKDMRGEKIKLWNNQGNRDFIRDHALALSQDLLTRNWADSRNGGEVEGVYINKDDPTDSLPDVQMPDGTVLSNGMTFRMPELTINGETIIVTRTGKMDSGQHRGIMFIFACQLWEMDEKWREQWPEKPTMEAVIFYGVSDSPRVTMTLDNVMPRTQADTIITSDDFADKTPAERRKLGPMLAYATDLLWKRTRVDLYQTHSASRAFRRRHPSIEKCVLHAFEENKEGPLSRLKLSASMVSGLMYLMAASASDETQYNKAHAAERTEDLVDFGRQVEVAGKKKSAWDAAELYVTLLCASGATEGADQTLAAISEKLVEIANATGNRASSAEQAALLCIAWNIFSGGGKLTLADLDLTDCYGTRDDGSKFIREHPNVGGIDRGLPSRDLSAGEEPTAEELKAAAAEKAETIKRENAEKQRKLVEEAKQKKAKKEDGVADSSPEALKLEASEKARMIREAAERRKAAKANGQPAAEAKPAAAASKKPAAKKP